MDFLELNGYAVVTLAINTLASMSYFYIYSSKKIKSHFFKLPQVLQKLYVAFFVLPIFIAPFIKQSKFSDYSLYLSLLGVILSIVVLRSLSCPF